MAKKVNGNDSVLSDHKKVGKKLLPPMLHKLPGVMTPTYYDRDTLPELIWLALLEDFHGLQVSADIASKFGQFAKKHKSDCRYITLSEMRQVSADVWNSLKDFLDSSGVLGTVLSAIHDFIVLFPECPLSALFLDKPSKLKDEAYLVRLESLVSNLTHKRGRKAVLMQANAIYLLGCQGKLFIKKGMSIANLEELKNYPETEESKIVGASVCSTSGMLVLMREQDRSPVWSWPEYFWKRCLQLKPVDYSHIGTSS